MGSTGDEINLLALSIARLIACNYNKDEIKNIKGLLALIIANLGSYNN